MLIRHRLRGTAKSIPSNSLLYMQPYGSGLCWAPTCGWGTVASRTLPQKKSSRRFPCSICRALFVTKDLHKLATPQLPLSSHLSSTLTVPCFPPGGSSCTRPRAWQVARFLSKPNSLPEWMGQNKFTTKLVSPKRLENPGAQEASKRRHHGTGFFWHFPVTQ